MDRVIKPDNISLPERKEQKTIFSNSVADWNLLKRFRQLSSNSVANTALNQSITTTGSDIDITGAALTFTLYQSKTILYIYTINITIGQNGIGDYSGNAIVKVMIDEVEKSRATNFGGVIGTDNSGASVATSVMNYAIDAVIPGPHTLKLTGRMDIASGTPYLLVSGFNLSYIILEI